MPRYIDAEKFLEDNKEFADREFIHPKIQATLRDIVDEAPAADVAPVIHAHWKITHPYLELMCSRCGEVADQEYMYCHCGAKMDEESEGGKDGIH